MDILLLLLLLLLLLESICEVKNKYYPQNFLDKFLNTTSLNNNDN